MFSFSAEERRVILFLAWLALLGIGINYWLKINPQAGLPKEIYQETGRIDINSADKELLMGIPGIGEKLAERIVAYRRQGEFKQSDELRKIKGISGSCFEKIKDYITVE